MTATLSVIIPVLDEAESIAGVLDALQPLRERGHELILVDGGSGDDTLLRTEGRVDRILVTAPGRARQLNAGAGQAGGGWLWFLHGDTRVTPEALAVLERVLEGEEACWGRFDIRLSGTHRLLRIVERMINLRSRLTGIATGDQGIFMARTLYRAVGGWPELPIMEDVAMSRRLRDLCAPRCHREYLVTSSRRWERHGIIRTILLMWWLRLAYALGVAPVRLARCYAAR